MAYNTGNPVGSTDPRDLKDNSEALDMALNSSDPTFVDRLGKTRPTLAGMETLATGVPAVGASIAAQEARAAAEAARDAALVQATVYATAEEGLADTEPGQYFKVAGAGDVAATEYFHAISPNLFNIATVRDGYYVPSSSPPNIQSAAGWGCSAFIPVTPGQQYTLSGTRGRVGLGFFSAASDGAGMAGTSDSTSTLPHTVTAPPGATHIAFNLYSASSPTYSNIQFELGAAATAYREYGAGHAVKIAEYPSIQALNTAIENQMKIFSSEEDGMSGTGVGEKFRVYGSGITAAVDYEHAISPNLFNAATVRDGYLLNSVNGAISAAADWGCSAFIPVLAGQQYTLSGTRSRYGIAFFTAANDAAVIAGSYSSSDGLPITVTAPVGATHCAFNLYSSSSGPVYSNIQFEAGSNSTDYIAFGAEYAKLLASYAASAPVVGDSSAKVVLSGDGASNSYIEVIRDGMAIRRSMIPWPETKLTASNVLNFTSDEIDGIVIRAMADEPAPYRAMGATIGANHGYTMTKITASGHGKTSADIGSVYSNGGAQYVLVGIVDASNVYITARASNGATPTGTLTYVSGGASSTNIVGTAAVVAQMYPVNNNRSMRVFVDGIEAMSHVANLRYRKSVKFVETYDVLEKSTIVEWYVSTGGAGLVPVGDPAFSVSIIYAFDIEGQCTIYTDFVARKSGITLQDLMFVMGIKMTSADGPVNYYIPKSLPLTHEGTDYNYSLIDSADTSAWSSRLDMTPVRCEPDGIFCDRVVQLSDNFGFALGYLPVQDASIENRRANATVKALQINNDLAKVYMSAIDNGSITLNVGDYYSVVAYRNIILRDPERTSLYAVRTNGDDYLYIDWHTDVTDRVPVPTDFVGRDFDVVEKSSNVSLLSQVLTGSLIVSVSAAGTYGYLILRVKK